MKKGPLVHRVFVGDEILPIYLGIVINQEIRMFFFSWFSCFPGREADFAKASEDASGLATEMERLREQHQRAVVHGEDLERKMKEEAWYPDAPCIEYLPSLWLEFITNVGI